MTPPWAFIDGMGLAHRRAVGAGHARPGGFPGDGRQQKVSGALGTPPPTRVGCPLTGSRANLRRGAGTPLYGCRVGLYAAREFMWDAVRRLLFFFQHWAGHTVENVSSLPGMDV